MLKADELIYAYTQGYFPMADPDEDGQIYWYKPELRGIIPLDSFHIPKNLKRLFKKEVFELRINTAFREVMEACAERVTTWISDEIIDTYCELHDRGYAHSFEVWQNGELVGGLYGVAIGKAFFGESMFHKVTDASKIALVYLVDFLNHSGFSLLDTQYINDHLLQFGAIEITNDEYEKLLSEALSTEA